MEGSLHMTTYSFSFSGDYSVPEQRCYVTLDLGTFASKHLKPKNELPAYKDHFDRFGMDREAGGTEESWKGTFLFFCMNATNIDSKRQQTALKTYVPGANLKWKRNERIKRLYASARLSANSIALSSRGLGLELMNGDSDYLPDRRPRRSHLRAPTFDRKALHTCESFPSASPEQDLPRRDRKHQNGILKTLIFFKGNSDPFSSTEVLITLFVNNLVLYTRDFRIPSAYLDWSRFKEPTKVIARC
jgi:hypothetical protein